MVMLALPPPVSSSVELCGLGWVSAWPQVLFNLTLACHSVPHPTLLISGIPLRHGFTLSTIATTAPIKLQSVDAPNLHDRQPTSVKSRSLPRTTFVDGHAMTHGRRSTIASRAIARESRAKRRRPFGSLERRSDHLCAFKLTNTLAHFHLIRLLNINAAAEGTPTSTTTGLPKFTLCGIQRHSSMRQPKNNA